MRLVDEAVIIARSGDGGRGCVSFLRKRRLPRGGPDGGDGGKGGNVIIRATQGKASLSHFLARQVFSAENGRPGRGENRTGRNGDDVIIEVPVGTTVYDNESGEELGDLLREDQEILVLEGGKGGKGNRHFVTSTNRAPRFAQPGLPGTEKRLRLSLRFLADIGIIGLPNTGKSTLISRLTNARPKIDKYPFTTLNPVLGIIRFKDGTSLTMADMPGLIDGASTGRGLGNRFLKHIERTKLLLHVLDATYEPRGEVLEDFRIVTGELEAYDRSLAEKEQIVLLNKIDVQGRDHRDLDRLQEALGDIGLRTYAISALTGEGLKALKETLKAEFTGREEEGECLQGRSF
ncbi:MAG: GTPase ObgE [Deltaproteobacteria bacterium]|nr:GTPase ObgE [Deltaproteobacteria bacterium]